MALNSRELCEFVLHVLDEKKADDLSCIPVAEKTSLADYFVMASANTPTHVKALADELIYRLKQDYDIQALGVEGFETGRWVLLDLGSVIVHIMHKQERSFYNLEKFWEGKEGENLSPLDSESQESSLS